MTMFRNKQTILSRAAVIIACMLPLAACGKPDTTQQLTCAAYFDSSGRDDVLAGGVKMIQIETPKGPFRVWTKRVGNNPKIKVLLLHGGPALTPGRGRGWPWLRG